MNTCRLTFIILGILFLAGCASIDVTYIGETFAPTPYAEIFFQKSDIHKQYEVIGKAIVRAPESFSGAEIQKKLQKVACEKGANAVLINLYKQIKVGANSFNNNFANGYNPWAEGGPYWNSYSCGGNSVEYIYEILVKAEFLRYK